MQEYQLAIDGWYVGESRVPDHVVDKSKLLVGKYIVLNQTQRKALVLAECTTALQLPKNLGFAFSRATALLCKDQTYKIYENPFASPAAFLAAWSSLSHNLKPL